MGEKLYNWSTDKTGQSKLSLQPEEWMMREVMMFETGNTSFSIYLVYWGLQESEKVGVDDGEKVFGTEQGDDDVSESSDVVDDDSGELKRGTSREEADDGESEWLPEDYPSIRMILPVNTMSGLLK